MLKGRAGAARARGRGGRRAGRSGRTTSRRGRRSSPRRPGSAPPPATAKASASPPSATRSRITAATRSSSCSANGVRTTRSGSGRDGALEQEPSPVTRCGHEPAAAAHCCTRRRHTGGIEAGDPEGRPHVAVLVAGARSCICITPSPSPATFASPALPVYKLSRPVLPRLRARRGPRTACCTARSRPRSTTTRCSRGAAVHPLRTGPPGHADVASRPGPPAAASSQKWIWTILAVVLTFAFLRNLPQPSLAWMRRDDRHDDLRPHSGH